MRGFASFAALRRPPLRSPWPFRPRRQRSSPEPGSTFVFPFFSKAFYIYNKLIPDITVNYQSIGSGGGIQQFSAKTSISAHPTFR